eukprot:4641219-Alexandrium_andersonii.AAC.1
MLACASASTVAHGARVGICVHSARPCDQPTKAGRYALQRWWKGLHPKPSRHFGTAAGAAVGGL